MDPVAVRADKLDLVERLADDLAHEIKNPLHSMVINLEVLKRRISRIPEGSDDLLHYAGILNGELERVNSRIELLLQIIRPDRSTELVSLIAALDEAFVLVELERERRGIRIDYEPVPHPVRGALPRAAARQIILDLLLAALDSLDPGGTLVVAVDTHEGAERLELTLPVPAPDTHPRRDLSARLEVVRQIGASLGAAVDVRSADAGGISLLLTLPASPR